MTDRIPFDPTLDLPYLRYANMNLTPALEAAGFDGPATLNAFATLAEIDSRTGAGVPRGYAIADLDRVLGGVPGSKLDVVSATYKLESAGLLAHLGYADDVDLYRVNEEPLYADDEDVDEDEPCIRCHGRRYVRITAAGHDDADFDPENLVEVDCPRCGGGGRERDPEELAEARHFAGPEGLEPY